MSKVLSTKLAYSVSIGLTVWVAGVNAALANPHSDELIAVDSSHNMASSVIADSTRLIAEKIPKLKIKQQVTISETQIVSPPTPAAQQGSGNDAEEIKQLIRSFRSETQGVNTRLQELETKTTALNNSSLPTTKLVGEAIFAVTGLGGGPNNATRNTILSDRLRLNFRTTFTGKDLLLVRLQSRNSNSFAGGATSAAKTNMTRLGFEGSEENATYIHRLQYQTPLSPSTKVFVESVGSELNDNYYTFNPEHQAAGTGAVTRFGRFNPIYRLNNEGAGIGVEHKFS